MTFPAGSFPDFVVVRAGGVPLYPFVNPVDDALMARLRAVFTDAEIVELGFAAGGFLMWGRLHRAFDVPASGPGYHAMLAQKSAGLPDAGSPSH